MFAVVQFPLTDARPLLDDSTGLIAAPVWPIVNLPDEPYKAPFVRGFGRARMRSRGGVDEWPAEGTYCNVSHALQLVQPTLKTQPQASSVAKRYCAFRRLFWDGQFEAEGSVVGRIEVGFGLREISPATPFDGAQVGDLLDALLGQKVRVAPGKKTPVDAGSVGKPGAVTLSNAGPLLAKAYLRASTATQHLPGLDGRDWWLQSGSPFLIVEYVRDQEVSALPARTLPISLTGATFAGIRVFMGKRVLEGRERPVWFFECDPAGCNRDALRRLRINVTRLQPTIASLRVLSDLILKKRVAPTSDAAKRNLNNCVGQFLPILYQKQYMGFASSEFLRAALTLEEALTPGEFATLRTIYPDPGRGLRSQLDRATDAVGTHQPSPAPPVQWDIFIAHAGADVAVAEQLYGLLKDRTRVFLDSECLRLGDDWDLGLQEAQRSAYMTVVLVGDTADTAYYLRSEIAAAISMARVDDQRYRVIPIYLQGSAGRTTAQPYGLDLKHGLELASPADLGHAADRILETLEATRPPG